MTETKINRNPTNIGDKNKLDKLSEIVDILLTHENNAKQNISLLSGKTGEAIFFYYYSKFSNEEKYADHGFKLLTEIFEEINNGFSFHTFAGGIAGIGWTVEHLARNGFLDFDTTDLLDVLDDYLFNCMMRDIKKGNYDYLHGAIGIGLYFVTKSNRVRIEKYLIALIDELENLAEEDAETGAVKWESVIDKDTNEKGYNISLSHGISSILVFLSKVYEKKIDEDRVLRLLNGTVTYLLQQQLKSNKFTSTFPNLALETRESFTSRLAWCYGDLGIGMALWHASQSTQNKKWEQKAVQVLMHSTKRRYLEESAVVDAGLCHGSAGIAHIYNRMYANTGVKEYKESANYWLNEMLKQASHESGLAGYKAWHTEKHGGWTNTTGLLEGIAGIGLTLIFYLSDLDPNWDECLLLS